MFGTEMASIIITMFGIEDIIQDMALITTPTIMVAGITTDIAEVIMVEVADLEVEHILVAVATADIAKKQKQNPLGGKSLGGFSFIESLYE